MNEIDAPTLAAWLADPKRAQPVLLDVREPWEFTICRLAGAVNIPMAQIAGRLPDIDQTRAVVCICHHGVRSARVAMFLQAQGFERLLNLRGGVAAWAEQVDSAMPQY